MPNPVPINHDSSDETPFVQTEMMKISDAEFHSIRDLVYQRFGITLSDEKKTLVVGRLQKILKQHHFSNFKQYYEMLVADKTDAAISELANQITTNHTFFFREPDHFDFFKSDILPWMVQEHKKKGNKDLRIWCAAASSGEEPYTLIITLLEHFGPDYKNWDCGLLATDVSEKALSAAVKGVYDPVRMQGVSPAIMHKYFRKTPEGHFAAVEQIKKEVTYRRFNLMNKTLPFKKKFDCIWCRNVMIYFDTPTKHELVNRMYDMTVDGGYLLIGHSETLDRNQTKWKYIKPAVYRKEG